MKKFCVLFIITILFLVVDFVNAKVDQMSCNDKANETIRDNKSSLDNSNSLDIKEGWQLDVTKKSDREPLKEAIVSFPIDKLVVIIDGPERRYTISQSELDRVGIDGRKPNLDDLIIEELMYQDALKHKIPLDDYAERYIRVIKKQHNLSDKDVERIFEGAGLSFEEGQQKLQKMSAANTMMDIKVKARIFIPQHEVEDYFKKYPEYKDAKYQLEVAFVPFFSRELKKQQEQLAYLMHQAEQNALDVMWGQPFWLKQSDIADDKTFLTLMKPGDVSKPQQVNDGFALYRLKDKKERKLIPLEKRFRIIMDILREPKFKEMLDGYVNELLANASLIYSDKNI